MLIAVCAALSIRDECLHRMMIHVAPKSQVFGCHRRRDDPDSWLALKDEPQPKLDLAGGADGVDARADAKTV